ncbi:TPA: IS1-like element transposase [Klebsiella pneumoniae]
MVCVVGRMRDLILQLSKSSIYSTKPSVSISCPSCSASDGVVRNGKSTAGHQRYLCSHCRKTWQLQFTYTASQPGTHQKIIDMAMNGVGCRATARIMGVGLNTILRHLKNSGRSR